MPGRYFQIDANPSSVTVPPGGASSLKYNVKNLIGRPVTAQFVIIPPDPTKASWANVSDAPIRAFVLDGTQEFCVAVNVPPGAPADAPGRNSQFGVFVKEQGDPQNIYDQGPPFTVVVKGPPAPTPGPKKTNKWLIPVAIGAAVIVVAIVLFVALRPKHSAVLPTVTGMAVAAAADTLKAHGFTDTIVGTSFASGTAVGTVLRQTPADSVAAKKDTSFHGLVQLVIAAPSVSLPNLRQMTAQAALDTLQKLTLLISDVTGRASNNRGDSNKVVDQQPEPGPYAQGTKVSLVVGVYPPGGGVRCVPYCGNPALWGKLNERATASLLRMQPRAAP